MKSVLSIVAFTVTFGFSVVLVGLLFGLPQTNYDYTSYSRTTCADQTCKKIERLINQDIKNGDIRDFEIRKSHSHPLNDMSIYEYTEFVSDYVNKSESMDASGLPSDFQKSWREHMKAWRIYSNFLNKRAISSHKMSNAEFNEYEFEFNLEINRTWYKTLRVGRSYGANFDQ